MFIILPMTGTPDLPVWPLLLALGGLLGVGVIVALGFEVGTHPGAGRRAAWRLLGAMVGGAILGSFLVGLMLLLG